jgi:UDP-glucuronate decarboxylase
MKILVTGSAGFLGTHLSQKLLSQNHKVVGVDNLYSGNIDNVKIFKHDKNYEFIEHDIIKPLDINVDAIINMACPASPIHYQKNPVATIKASVLGMINMLDLAKKLEVPILQCSTSEVYGDPLISPQIESYWGNVNPIGIRSCYDEGKRVAETLMYDYWRQFNVQIKIARIFNTYGPGMHLEDGRVVSNFIYQAIQNRPITIYGEGLQTRSFCFISDTIEALVKFIETNKSVVGPMNIGNPDEISIDNLASKIISLTKSKSKIVKSSLPQDDPKQRKPDIKLAIKALDWEPRVSLDDGLDRTIDDFISRIGRSDQKNNSSDEIRKNND